jgi:hypothetical protein
MEWPEYLQFMFLVRAGSSNLFQSSGKRTWPVQFHIKDLGGKIGTSPAQVLLQRQLRVFHWSLHCPERVFGEWWGFKNFLK